jgi:hypothetical protein
VLRAGGLRPLLALAAYHQVDSYVAAAIAAREDVDPSLQQDLRRRQAYQAATNLRILGELKSLGALLHHAGLVWMLVKGPVLAELMYPSAMLRPYQDLDVVVPRRLFATVIRTMEEGGYAVLDRNWDLIRRERRGQLHLWLPHGGVADVHWHLLNRDTVRRTLTVDMESTFARARTVPIRDMEVQTLDPVDTLVHLCVHAALSGGDRLRWLKDVERQIAFDRPNWDLVARRAHEWRAETMVSTILRRSRTTLGARVPDSVTARLAGSRLWHFGAGLVDRAWPPERSVGGASPLVVWTQSTRDSALAGLSALLRRVARRTLVAVRGLPGRSEATSDGATDVFSPSGDATSRARFLAEVGGGEAGAQQSTPP